jgi:hypothetical protein
VLHAPQLFGALEGQAEGGEKLDMGHGFAEVGCLHEAQELSVTLAQRHNGTKADNVLTGWSSRGDPCGFAVGLCEKE